MHLGTISVFQVALDAAVGFAGGKDVRLGPSNPLLEDTRKAGDAVYCRVITEIYRTRLRSLFGALEALALGDAIQPPK